MIQEINSTRLMVIDIVVPPRYQPCLSTNRQLEKVRDEVLPYFNFKAKRPVSPLALQFTGIVHTDRT